MPCTALYEVVPVGVTNAVSLRGTEPVRYCAERLPRDGSRGELLYVQLRYKRPGASASRLLTHPVLASSVAEAPSADFRFAAAVAEFGMLLRDSEHKGRASADKVLTLARGSVGGDEGATGRSSWGSWRGVGRSSE